MLKRVFEKLFAAQSSKAPAENTAAPTSEYEPCVLCGSRTDITFSTPIDLRTGYVPGCGQLCKHCLEKMKSGEFSAR